MQVAERVLSTVVVGVVVRVDGLRLEPRDGVELLDRRGAQARQRASQGSARSAALLVLGGKNDEK